MPAPKARQRSRTNLSALLFALLLTLHVGCSSEESGTENVEPETIDRIDTPRRPTLPDRSNGLIEFDPRELNVKADVQLIFSTSDSPGDFDSITNERVEERRDAIFGLDYSTGVGRELVRAPNEGRLAFPLPILVDENRLYYLTSPPSAESVRVRGVDPASGAPTSDTEITGLLDRCAAVAGGDFYFSSLGDFFVARDLIDRDVVTSPTRLGDAESLCRDGLVSLDGAAVTVEAPTSENPTVDTIRLVAIDPSTGELEPEPLLSVPVSQVTLGTEGERPPLLAAAVDGLYVLASDFIAIEVWFVPYARRPGDPPAAGPGGAPERLSRIDIPFFADVIPPGGSTLAVFRLFGFAATDGVAAIPLRLEETAGNSRFFWNVLVVIDFEAGAVDLLGNGPRLEFFEMLGTGAPG